MPVVWTLGMKTYIFTLPMNTNEHGFCKFEIITQQRSLQNTITLTKHEINVLVYSDVLLPQSTYQHFVLINSQHFKTCSTASTEKLLLSRSHCFDPNALGYLHSQITVAFNNLQSSATKKQKVSVKSLTLIIIGNRIEQDEINYSYSVYFLLEP